MLAVTGAAWLGLVLLLFCDSFACACKTPLLEFVHLSA